MSEIVTGVRRALLARCAAVERWRRERVAELEAEADAGVVSIHTGRVSNPEHFPTAFPLFADPWPFADSDVLLAAKEAAALGEIELRHTEIGPMVRVTERGLASEEGAGE